MTFTKINGSTCKFHSVYKGWEIYRAWDVVEDHGRMLYYGVKATDKGMTTVQAKNLDSVKAMISKVSSIDRMGALDALAFMKERGRIVSPMLPNGATESIQYRIVKNRTGDIDSEGIPYYVLQQRIYIPSQDSWTAWNASRFDLDYWINTTLDFVEVAL